MSKLVVIPEPIYILFYSNNPSYSNTTFKKTQ